MENGNNLTYIYKLILRACMHYMGQIEVEEVSNRSDLVVGF